MSCRITIEEESSIAHVLVEDDIERNGSDPLIEYVMSSYAFLPAEQTVLEGRELDYAWAPNLRPANDHVIGDRSFHSPAVIVQEGRLMAALVPDLRVLSKNRVMPAALDLDRSNGLLPAPLLSYGFCGYEETPDGNYHSHDITMARRLSSAHLTYGYDLILEADCKCSTAHSSVARHLWNIYGKQEARGSRDRSTPTIPHSAIEPDAWAAFGLRALGSDETTDGEVYTADNMKDILLSSPQDGGLFPTRYDLEHDEWAGCRNSMGNAEYHTVECSEQLYWLLKWHQEIEKDPAIIRFCRSYADFLISARLRNGAIPSWYTRSRIPLSVLRTDARTAMSALFLAELGRVTGLSRVIKGCRAINEVCSR